MMWARIVEMMLGCWLAVSPFVFRHSDNEHVLWTNDLLCALAVITLALISFWRPLGWAHLVSAGVALWLIAFGYFASYVPPLPPGSQNEIIIGLLLLMLAIIPNEASLPPKPWRKFYRDKQGAASAGAG